MKRTSYRFTVYGLTISVILLVLASVVLTFQEKDVSPLIPVIAPVLAGLGGLLVSPPSKQ